MSQAGVIYANGPGQDKCVFSRLLLEAFRWLRSRVPPGSWLKTVAYYWIFRQCDNNVCVELFASGAILVASSSFGISFAAIGLVIFLIKP